MNEDQLKQRLHHALAGKLPARIAARFERAHSEYPDCTEFFAAAHVNYSDRPNCPLCFAISPSEVNEIPFPRLKAILMEVLAAQLPEYPIEHEEVEVKDLRQTRDWAIKYEHDNKIVFYVHPVLVGYYRDMAKAASEMQVIRERHKDPLQAVVDTALTLSSRLKLHREWFGARSNPIGLSSEQRYGYPAMETFDAFVSIIRELQEGKKFEGLNDYWTKILMDRNARSHFTRDLQELKADYSTIVLLQRAVADIQKAIKGQMGVKGLGQSFP